MNAKKPICKQTKNPILRLEKFAWLSEQKPNWLYYEEWKISVLETKQILTFPSTWKLIQKSEFY